VETYLEGEELGGGAEWSSVGIVLPKSEYSKGATDRE